MNLADQRRAFTSQEVSFQYFRNELLARGLVEKLEVLNKNVVRVYVRTGAAAAGGGQGDLQTPLPSSGSSSGSGSAEESTVYKFYFNIGSIDSFERKMEEAQEAFGVSLGEEVTPCNPFLDSQVHTYSDTNNDTIIGVGFSWQPGN